MIDEEYNIVKEPKREGVEFEYDNTVSEFADEGPSHTQKYKKRQVSAKMQSLVSAVVMSAVVAGGAVSVSQTMPAKTPSSGIESTANVKNNEPKQSNTKSQNNNGSSTPATSRVEVMPTTEPTSAPTIESTTVETSEPDVTSEPIATPVATQQTPAPQSKSTQRRSSTQTPTRVISSSSYTVLGGGYTEATVEYSPIPTVVPSPTPSPTPLPSSTPSVESGGTTNIEVVVDELNSTVEPVPTKEPTSNVQTQSFTTDIKLEIQGE